MTEAEHHARAMLMGFRYIPHFGYYRKITYPGVLRLDALTLDELSTDEARKRQNTKPMKEIWYD